MAGETGRDGAPLVVVIVGCALGLPHGMAATSRVKLFSRALADAGDTVRVMLTTATERPPDVLNTESRGVVDGIPFEYTTGTTVRARTFLGRRSAEVRGVAVAIVRLVALRRGRRRLVVLAFIRTTKWSPRYVTLTTAARALGIPVVLEFCELPWTLMADRRPWEALWSPLALTSGAITISSYLTRWTNAEYASRHSTARATEVPILVDVDEVRPSPYPRARSTALYCAGPGYDESLAFVLEAMRCVWLRQPQCQLVVTGIAPHELGRHLSEWGLSQAEAGRVLAVGRVSRDALLQLYSDASVCLAPLFDDRRSTARFPTKIAEYAAAARPVVTSSVGEARRYLQDGATAFLAEPGDAAAFGGKIIEALSDPELAAAVGIAARELAERLFDYRVHAASLHEALASALACASSHAQGCRHA